MADNVTLNPGAAGAVIATDDITSVHYPISKLAFGALDTAVLAVAGSGVVTTGTLRVTLATDVALPAGTNAIGKLAANTGVDIGDVDVTSVAGNVTVINAGTFATQVDGAALTALQLVDDVVHSGDAAVSKYALIGAVLDDAATGAVTENQANALRMSSRRALLVEGVASGTAFPVTQSGTWDEVGINDSGNSITVDWAGTAPPIGAGVEATALRVTLATDSTGLVSVDDNGGSLTIDNAQLSVVGTGTEAAAMRVTIATDSTGVLSVDDNGGSLTVDGTVTANLAAGTNNIGDVDVLSVVPGTAATNLGKAEDAAHTTADTGVYVLAVRDDALAAHSGADGDYESLHTNALGALYVQQAPNTTGGLTIFQSIDLDESEEEVKATAGQLYSIAAFNHTAAPLYLKFYNLTAANTTVGTSTPVATFTIPGNADSDGAGFVWNNTIGLAFSTAISAAVTTGIAVADTGAPAANAASVVLGYA